MAGLESGFSNSSEDSSNYKPSLSACFEIRSEVPSSSEDIEESELEEESSDSEV